MKKYKLLKELPFHKIGSIWEYDHSQEMYLNKEKELSSGFYKNDMGYLIQNEWFEEIKEEEDMMGELEKEYNKKYYVIDNSYHTGHICVYKNDKYFKQIKAFIILSELAEKLNESREANCYVSYNTDTQEFEVGQDDTNTYIYDRIYIRNFTTAYKAIKLGRDYWLQLFNIQKSID